MRFEVDDTLWFMIYCSMWLEDMAVKSISIDYENRLRARGLSLNTTKKEDSYGTQQTCLP